MGTATVAAAREPAAVAAGHRPMEIDSVIYFQSAMRTIHHTIWLLLAADEGNGNGNGNGGGSSGDPGGGGSSGPPPNGD